MHTHFRLLTIAASLLSLFVITSDASAQGLIWSLPEVGSWVRYEGNYSQVVRRPNATAGDLQLQWTRHLTIKSLESVEEPFEGEIQPCRWIELKVTTAQQAAVLEPGPGGARTFKVLVPERLIQGTVLDGRNILVAHIPVVRGYRKIGDEDPQPIESDVLQVYPVISFVQHYRNLEADSAGPTTVDLPIGSVSATLMKGDRTMESPTSRSMNTAQLWRSDDVPFGLAKWIVKDVLEQKFATQPRTEFRETTEVNIEMTATEVGTAAVTEIDLR